MADTDKTKKTKKQKANKKSTSSKSVSGDCEEELTCQMCTDVFNSPDDKLMECERCENWFCAECLEMSAEVYDIMVDRKDVHWFCAECEKPAITAVKSDKEIEEKCAAYMSSITDKIENIEEQLSCKADKSALKELDARLKELENKGGDKPKDSNTQRCTVREAIAEQKEREYRLKNIMVLNLPESTQENFEDKIAEDMATFERVLAAIGIEEEEAITRCVRIPNKDREGKDEPRMLKVILNSVETKRQVLKKAKALKDNKDFENVFIDPDLTKMQKTEQYELRKELRERRAAGEENLFLSRGRVIRGKDKSKGGSSNLRGSGSGLRGNRLGGRRREQHRMSRGV